MINHEGGNSRQSLFPIAQRECRYRAQTRCHRLLQILLLLLANGIKISQSLQQPDVRINGRKDPSVTARKGSTTEATTSPSSKPPPPLPPWNFQASRIYYQFRAIPTNQARKYCPPFSSSSSSQSTLSSSSSSTTSSTPAATSTSSPLVLLSAAGCTLGGIFCIEYDDSPIGPYREVAILSSLVAGCRSSAFLPLLPLSIGAWASHIFVDSNDAAEYGARYWGLPTTVMPIHFEKKESDDDVALMMARSSCDVMFSNAGIKVSGWNCCEVSNGESKSASSWLSSDWIDLSLPSFSGCLPSKEQGQEMPTSSSSSPLLQYPLRILRPQSISLVENGDVHFIMNDSVVNSQAAAAIAEVKDLLTCSHSLLSVDIRSVNLVAGKAVAIA